MKIKINKNEFRMGVNACDVYLGMSCAFTSSEMVADILMAIFKDKISIQDENKVVQRVCKKPGKDS